MNRTLHGGLHGQDEPSSAAEPPSDDLLLRPAPRRPMPFWQMFARVLPSQPSSAVAALYWHLTRRRVRARNRLAKAAAGLPFAYDLWIREAEDAPGLVRAASIWSDRSKRHPRISVVIDATQLAAAELEKTLRSVEEQLYTGWTLDVLVARESECAKLPADARVRWSELSEQDRAEALFEAIEQAGGDYLMVLAAGSVLAAGALLRIAEAAASERAPLIIYGDHDELGPDGRRRNPWFKPGWNEEMFLALDYLSPAVAVRTDIARRALEVARTTPGAVGARMLLEATRLAEDRIMRIPHILCHAPPGGGAIDAPERIHALEAHLEGTRASVTRGPFGTTRISWPLPNPLPLVSIIVPTRDKLELLVPCVESLLERTCYPEFELLVVDNRSAEPATADYFRQLNQRPQVRILSYDRDYNFSAINNFAVQQARGAYLCLLNNDTEVVNGDWLTELMRYAVRPKVGAVGAKLLFPDGKIQHAGVVIGLGEAAGHAHRFDASDEPGYFRQAHVAQYVSAVTAACLVVEKTKFESVGGLDEEGFPVAFNDVDFCLKLQAAGWRNVYTPHAVLIHHESKSRGKDHAPDNVARFTREYSLLQRRWQTNGYEDPFHNPNLDRQSERFIISL